ncbi:MAG: hypothetical protein ACFB0C_15605 [Leptolyngbyaceae cyanobacterium]
MIDLHRNTSLEREATLAAIWHQVKQMPPGVLEMQFMALYELCLNQSDALVVVEGQLRRCNTQIHVMQQSLLFLQRITPDSQQPPFPTPSEPAPQTPP